MPELDAVGGWIKDYNSRECSPLRRLCDLRPDLIDKGRIEYFEDYQRRYYNDRLTFGQGTEQMLSILSRFGANPGDWLDLGCGVTTLFWSIGLGVPMSISVCDVVPEALFVLDQFRLGTALPGCYRDALTLLGRDVVDLKRIRKMHWNFLIFDCLKAWPELPVACSFHTVTSIGCFGLAPHTRGYAEAFLYAAKALRSGGRMIGADWIRSATFIEREGHDNRYLTASLVAACASEAALTPLEIAQIPISGDANYDAMIVWAFEL